MSKWVPPLLAFVFLLITTACISRDRDTGILYGHVNIGPLVPVVREGESEPTPSPEIYAARQIVILDARGNKEIQRVQIEPDGNYSIALPTGTYTVDINRIGIDSAAELPKQIEIRADQTLKLDISIDTGIR